MGGLRHGRLARARSPARSLGALAATRRRQKPRSAASVSRCRADHDDAPGTHVGRLHDHDTPSVIGITAASSAHVHCVPWKFERAPSAMFGETLAGPLRGSNAPPSDDTAKRVGTYRAPADALRQPPTPAAPLFIHPPPPPAPPPSKTRMPKIPSKLILCNSVNVSH